MFRAGFVLVMLVLVFGSSTRAQQPRATGSNGGTDLNVPTGLREGTGGQPTAAEATEPPNSENLSIPSGLREGTGGGPTGAMQEEGKAQPFDGPGWLDKALGLGESPVQVHGWIQNTFTGNTNGTPPSGRNFALYPNYLANQWMGNQYYLVFERPLEQNDRVNVGFRIDALFGYDWQVVKAYGFFDNAFTPNSFTGFDLPQIYAEAHLPILTKGGLDLKFGRWYSIAGYEQIPAVRRPLLSWPYIFTYFPFTFSGLMTTFHLTDRVNLYNGVVPGVDRWLNIH
ncbi:MAG TPA: outer membrane beta-barrel protein, partial [Isosphaeraceae bacterium]|nr:outer membrane beta-barrel protein [Isosphaeraceae bacterium]